jgi:hypothetical protein
MAHGGKVNYREHYAPPRDTGLYGPYTRMNTTTADLVLVWLSGCAVGVVLTLLATGQ